MQIRQIISFLLLAILAPLVFAQGQGDPILGLPGQTENTPDPDYTPSAATNTAILEAQADGTISDAEAVAIAQAMAADNATPAQIATAMNNTQGVNSTVQIAAGLSALGQSVNQVANTLATTGVTNQATARGVAQQGRTTAIANGARVVTFDSTNTTANAGNFSVTGSGLIVDGTGRAIVVEDEGSQLQFLFAVAAANEASGNTSPSASQSFRNNFARTLTVFLGLEGELSEGASNEDFNDLIVERFNIDVDEILSDGNSVTSQIASIGTGLGLFGQDQLGGSGNITPSAP